MICEFVRIRNVIVVHFKHFKIFCCSQLVCLQTFIIVQSKNFNNFVVPDFCVSVTK